MHIAKGAISGSAHPRRAFRIPPPFLCTRQMKWKPSLVAPVVRSILLRRGDIQKQFPIPPNNFMREHGRNFPFAESAERLWCRRTRPRLCRLMRRTCRFFRILREALKWMRDICCFMVRRGQIQDFAMRYTDGRRWWNWCSRKNRSRLIVFAMINNSAANLTESGQLRSRQMREGLTNRKIGYWGQMFVRID